MRRDTLRHQSVLLIGALIAASLLASGAEGRGTALPSGRTIAHRDGKIVRLVDLPVVRANSIMHEALEPTIGLSPGADIFVTGASFGGAGGMPQTEIVRSTDQGATWETVSPRVMDENARPVTLDPYILVDDVDGDNARIYTIDLTVACSYVSFSDDEGENWTTNPLACGRPVNDHQTLFAGPPVTSQTVGYPHILYYCFSDVGTSQCTKSIDGGLTFVSTGEPAFIGYESGNDDTGDNVCNGIHGHGVVGTDGSVYLPKDYCDKPFLAISRNEGLTWERMRVTKTMEVAEHERGVSPDPSVAVDAHGNIYYAFIDRWDRMPHLTVSQDGGETWSRPVRVSPPGLKEANLVTLTVGGPGKVAFAYYASENSPHRRCRIVWCQQDRFDQTTWNAYLTISEDALDEDPLFLTGEVNDPDDPMIRRRCGPGRCSRAYDFIDVTIGNDGVPYAIFVDACMADCETQNGQLYEGVLGRLLGGPNLH